MKTILSGNKTEFKFFVTGDPDDSLAPPPSDPDISFSIRQKAVKSVLQQGKCSEDDVTIFIFDMKTQYR